MIPNDLRESIPSSNCHFLVDDMVYFAVDDVQAGDGSGHGLNRRVTLGIREHADEAVQFLFRQTLLEGDRLNADPFEMANQARGVEASVKWLFLQEHLIVAHQDDDGRNELRI